MGGNLHDCTRYKGYSVSGACGEKVSRYSYNTLRYTDIPLIHYPHFCTNTLHPPEIEKICFKNMILGPVRKTTLRPFMNLLPIQRQDPKRGVNFHKNGTRRKKVNFGSKHETWETRLGTRSENYLGPLKCAPD